MWEERLAFLAQEPDSQFMRLEVYDWDGINLKARALKRALNLEP